jgi:hypothetical protein
MSDDKKDAPKIAEPKKDAAEVELTDAELGEVAGGFNPQPDPPGKTIG